MRILHVVPAYAPAWRYGGPIRSVHELCRAFAQRGHDVHVYTTNVDGPETLDVPTDVPVDMHGVKVWYFAVQCRPVWYSRSMAVHLSRTVAEFDVVHLHSIFLWPTMAAARESFRQRVPYVIAPRGMLVRDLFSRKSRLAKWLWFYLFEKRTLEQAAAIHATSQLEVDEARRFKLRWPPFAVIANGVETPMNSTGALSPGEAVGTGYASPYILFIGRINWKKGLDRLVASLTFVPPSVRLIIAGNDEAGYRAEVERLAREHGVTERVEFAGPVEGRRKAALLGEAALLALPSYSENFGNVVLEAMAFGCPVVVTPEVGLASVVADTHVGLVAGGEPAALGAAMNRILSNRDLARQMGQRGRQVVAKEFDWDAIACKMERLYGSILLKQQVDPAFLPSSEPRSICRS